MNGKKAKGIRKAALEDFAALGLPQRTRMVTDRNGSVRHAAGTLKNAVKVAKQFVKKSGRGK